MQENHSHKNLVHSLVDQPLTDKKNPKPKFLISFLGVSALIVIVISIFVYTALVVPGQRVVLSLKQLETVGRELIPMVKDQDLVAMKNQLSKIQIGIERVESDLSAMRWTSGLPWVGNYYRDAGYITLSSKEIIKAGNVAIAAISPYADVIGLKGLVTTGDGAKTAQDRINFIVNTIDKLQPQLEVIGGHLRIAKENLDKVDPNRYPEEFSGIKVRSQLVQAISLMDQASSLVNDARPLLESAPYILGLDSERKYLVLFQNDAELRPTGGFLTGYAVIAVNKGKISTLESDDIYKLDEKFKKRIPAPDPIKKYHPLVPFWYLRDQNLSPDFRVSMETFMPNYKQTGSPTVDGVIAVDTQLLVSLLEVTGPIGVSGLGNFSANNDPRCNCPQVFYELQLLAGGEEAVVWDSVSGKIVKAPENYGKRKAFLGPFMYSVLSNVMAQPKAKMGQLFTTGMNAISSKHVLTYFFDEKAQSAAESFNMAGRVREAESDYLMVVDTNFSGAKTNIWVNYKADQIVEISGDGTVTKTLSLTYSNPEVKAVKVGEGRNLNGMFRNWHRVFVPKGSELIEATGYETGQATGEDLGKTVFEGFFTLAPGNTKKITLKYKLPFKIKHPYKLLVQKQGGSKVFPIVTSVNQRKGVEELLDSDKELVISY